MDEMGLINAARQGNLQAFNELVLKYQDTVYNHSVYLLKNHEAAEDITQDAFLKAYQNLSDYQGGSFRAWVLRIATNACLDELRRWKRHPLLPLTPVDADGEENESPYWIYDPSPSPEESYERIELRETLQRYLDDLPVDQRTTLVLVDLLDVDYAEVAEITNVPIGTVKSRLARARLRIRERLQRIPDLLSSSFSAYERQVC